MRRLREREPVSWVPEVGMWFVTRRDHVLHVLADFETFTVDSPHSIIRQTFGRHMMTTDGPEQIRYKRTCMPPFRPKDLLRTMSGFIEREVASLIGHMADQDRGELRLGLANPLAIRTVMSILGLPLEEAANVRQWYDCFAEALANFRNEPKVRARGRLAAEEFATLVSRVIAAPNHQPGGLLQRLRAADPPWTRDEIVSNALIIMFGGIETTESMMCNAIWALLEHPDQLEVVRRDPGRIVGAIEESLRWEPAVQSCTRHVTRATSLGTVTLAPGDIVQCMLGGANRDPNHFDDPDRFDIARPNAKDHVSFGAGRHFCLGAPLASLETELAIRGVLTRFSRLALDPDYPTAPRGYEFRKPPHLWVVWSR